MNIPYRTRRVINRVGIIVLALLLVGILAWLCWVVWLERYVVYSGDSATLDFSVSAQELTGEVALPPVAEANVSIYYNEGSDALNTSNEMTKLSGYYIDIDMMQTDMDNIMTTIQRLSSDTAIMIDMKGAYGSFYYSSTLEDALISASTDIDAVAKLLTAIQKKGFYTIARISSLRDYNFGLNHVTSGLYMLNRAGLWMDQGFYWLDPTTATTTSWITSIVLELKEMGFDEVMLADFRFPNSTEYIFNGDKPAALQEAAAKLISTCGSSDFTLSFGVDDPTFALPADSRCRIYLEGIDAGTVETKISQVTVADPEIQVVFVAETNDTRFDNYSVLRSLSMADVIEAQKSG